MNINLTVEWRHRALFSSLLCMLAGFLSVTGALAQTPEEHASHHPGAAGAGPGGMGPPAGVGPPGGMGDMGEMMKGMGVPPPKDLYPSLMAVPELSPELRKQVEAQSGERMHAGTVLMGQALDTLNAGTQSGDYAAMHEATARLREGIAQLESGIAARRALAEGRAPREVALAWFKQEMNLSPGIAPAAPELFGSMGFHLIVIVLLAAFAIAMIAMYFFKMRRAADLLQHLTGGGPSMPSAGSPQAAPAPGAFSMPMATPAAPTAQPTARKWSGKLRVGRIFQETPDVKTFRLMNPLGGILPFSYLPGQFLTVAISPDGELVKRSYTISSSPTQHDYAEITVKHEIEGVVSAFLHNRVQEGDLLDFSGPSGLFTFSGRECKCILLIGGGVGITPLMSVLRYLTDRSWQGEIFLIYGVRTPADIIFREELEHLQRRHPNLRVVITISRLEGTDWKGPTGHISKELIIQSVPDVATRYVHICGPVSMMETVKHVLAELGVPPGRVKTEAFGPALGKPEAVKPITVPAAGGIEEKAAQKDLPTVTFSRSDKSAPLPSDKSILEVAEEIGVEIDNSCRIGTCGTCRVKLLSGKVTMAVEDSLEPGDKEKGIILACQAKATENVEVEA